MNASAAVRPSAPGDLLSLTKPGITRMVVLTAAGGLWLTPGPVSAWTAAATLVGLALVVSGANALNCWFERDSDGFMRRTAGRPLPAGRMAPQTAFGIGLGLPAVGLPVLALGTNVLSTALAAVALLSYVLVYTPLKRRTAWSTVVGAVPGALPPLIGWTAGAGSVGLPGLVLFGILFLWQMPHFHAIAWTHREEYARAGLHTLPGDRGEAVTRRHMIGYTLALVPVSLLLVPMGVAGAVYLAGAAVLGGGFLWLVLRRGPDGLAWARRVFHGSLVYLSGVVLLLIVDTLL